LHSEIAYAIRMIDQGRASRLKQARELAGYATGSAAAEAFGWKYPTYQGHENGTRGIRPDNIEKYASAFRVDLRWLMTGAGQAGRPYAAADRARPAPGFSEGDVTPFVARTATEGRAVEKAVQLLAPQVTQPIIYHSTKGSPCFSILPGDILVIASQAEGFRTGQLVVATLEGPNGEGVTVLRQTAGNMLVAPPGYELPDEASLPVGILGAVMTVIRLPMTSLVNRKS
jgi:hypothetical protein